MRSCRVFAYPGDRLELSMGYRIVHAIAAAVFLNSYAASVALN